MIFLKKILVAVDGSESCYKVAKKAEDLALLCRSSVTFLTVIDSKFKLITSEEQLEKHDRFTEQQIRETKQSLNKCKEIYKGCESSLESEGLETKRDVIQGQNPALNICEYAEKNEFDLIVIADKGRSYVKKFLLGSTTEKVVRHSNVSVLVVK